MNLDVVCPKCGKDGFVWNRTECFHCGFHDPTRVILSPEEHEAKLSELERIESALPPRSEPLPPDMECPHCERQGFAWKRHYCEYCGYDPRTEGLGHPIAAYTPRSPWSDQVITHESDGSAIFLPPNPPKGLYQGGGVAPMFPAPSSPKPLGRTYEDRFGERPPEE